MHENLSHVKYRMSLFSFNVLLKILSPALTLKHLYAIKGGLEPISCELMLQCAIRYLAGGSYHDVWASALIRKASFYFLVWHTIDCRLWLSNFLVPMNWMKYSKDVKRFLGLVC